MTASLIAHGLPPALIATSLVWRAGVARGDRRGLWLGTLLALSLALGLAGFDSMAVRVLWPALIGSEWVLEVPLAAATLWWASRIRRRPWQPAAPPTATSWRLAGEILLTASLVLAACAAASAIWQNLLLYPHGPGSDSIALWNVKARFLYRGGGRLWRVFDPALMHSRYPLLLPAVVARLWGTLGHDTPMVPQGLVLSFFGLVIGVLVTTLHVLRGWVTACLSGLSVLSLPFFLENAGCQCADLPLSLFALASLSCFVIATERPEGELGSLALAGAFAGLAAWTKVEGLLLMLGLLGAVATGGGRGLVAKLRRAGFLLAGSFPLLLTLFLLNAAYLTAASEYANQPASLLLGRALSLDRHRQIVSAALRFALGEQQWVALALLALAAVAWRFSRRGAACPAQRPFLVALCLVSAGLYAVYVITPYPLDWQLNTSLDRLFIQYWPSLVLLAFIGGPGPAPPRP